MGNITVWAIGLVLLLAGLLKAVNPRPFISHVHQLKILPPKLCGLAAYGFIQIENTLAMALLLNVFLPEIILVSIFLLIFLSLLTFWAYITDRIENCGCYGRFIWLKPYQSLLLNVLYCAGLFYVWTLRPISMPLQWSGAAILIFTVGVTGFLIKRSLVKPILNIVPLRPGRQWNQRWGLQEQGIGSQCVLLMFVKDNCSLCRKWKFIFGELAAEQFKGSVYWVKPRARHLNTKQDDQSEIALSLTPFYFSYLVDQTPSAVLMENGVIIKKWENEFPYELFSGNVD